MATIRIVLGIVCLAFLGWAVKPGGDILVDAVRGGVVELWGRGVVESIQGQLNNSPTEQLNLSTTEQLNPDQLSNPTTKQLNLSTTKQLNISTILAIARSQIGVHEATGKNDGLAVESYLRYTGNKKGEPWCASFVSWVYGQAGHAQPKTAWSPGLFPLARQSLKPLPANVFGVYFTDLHRIAHCGLVESRRGNWLCTIEGNTNVAGSREGDGVYRKLRHCRTIKVYADWLKEPGKEEQRIVNVKVFLLGKKHKANARSLPRGHFHFSLMKNETKNQVRNEASPLEANAWPAVPACPTLPWPVVYGLGFYDKKGHLPPSLLDGNNVDIQMERKYHTIACYIDCLGTPRKEGARWKS